METPVKPKGKPYKLEDRGGRQVRVYESGTVLDHETGKIIQAPSDTLITPQKARSMVEIKVAKKHERVQAGALAFVRRADPETWGDAVDDDWVEAVSEAQMAQAMRVGDPGMTRAAEWLMTHSGLAEPKQAEQAGPAAGSVTEAVKAMTVLVETIEKAINGADNYPYRKHKSTPETVDATATPVHDGALPPVVDGEDDE